MCGRHISGCSGFRDDCGPTADSCLDAPDLPSGYGTARAVPHGGPSWLPREPGCSGMSRPAGHGPVPWPGPHPDLAGRRAGRQPRDARAGSPACRCGCASCAHQPPWPRAGSGLSRPSSGAASRRPRRRGEYLVGYRTSPAHPRDRGLGVIAELLGHPLGAPSAAVRAYGRGNDLADLAWVGLIGVLQRRCGQGVGPDRAGAGITRG